MRTEGYSILAAMVLHGALFVAARRMPRPVLVTDADRAALQTIDIEIPTALPPELRTPPPPPDQVDPAARPAEAERPPDRVARAAVPTPGGAPRPSETSSPEATPALPGPAATQAPTQFDELPPDDGRGGMTLPPGIGGRPIYNMPGMLTDEKAPPAPTTAPAPRQVPKDIATRIINEAMAAKDKSIGLDLPMAGAMRTAAQNAVMGSDIPAGAKGSVTCNISPSGVVSGCRLRSSTMGSNESWAVATRAAAAVAGTALPGQYAKGAVVTLNIDIANTPPAGSKGGISGAGANFDISNIGAHSTRRVHVTHSVAAVP